MTHYDDMSLTAGCARACTPCRGVVCERHRAHHHEQQAFKQVRVMKASESDTGNHVGQVPDQTDSASTTESCRDIVQETVDAISGATWNTRNMIMEDLFRQDMADHGDAMPAYRPPGE